MTWGWGQVGILSLLTLILATAAAPWLTAAGVSPRPQDPSSSPPCGPGARVPEGAEDTNQERKGHGQIGVTEWPGPALRLLLPVPWAQLQRPQVWRLSSLLPASSSLPSDSSLPPVPRRGPVASVVRMSQVYGLEVLPGGCSLSCNRLWGGGGVRGQGTLLAAATLACHSLTPAPTPQALATYPLLMLWCQPGWEHLRTGTPPSSHPPSPGPSPA